MTKILRISSNPCSSPILINNNPIVCHSFVLVALIGFRVALIGFMIKTVIQYTVLKRCGQYPVIFVLAFKNISVKGYAKTVGLYVYIFCVI